MDVILSWLYELYTAVPGWLVVEAAVIFGLTLAIWLTTRFVQNELARAKVKQALKTLDPDSSPTEIAKATGLTEDKVMDVLEDLEIEGLADEEADEERWEKARFLIIEELMTAPDSSVDEIAKATGLKPEMVESLIDDVKDDLMIEAKFNNLN